MGIVLTKKQTEAFNLALSGHKQFVLFGGAVGGGKSYLLFTLMVHLSSVYPGSRWVFVRKDLQTIKRNSIPTLNKFLELGLDQHVKRFNKETYTLEFNNGSEIMFMGENYDKDPELNRFRGLEINGAFVDELNETQYETLNKLFERSGRWGTDAPIIIVGTCNPTHNWVKEKIYDKWIKGTLPESWAYIPSLITDNPYLSQEYVDNLKANMEASKYRRFVEGDWELIETDNAFAYQFDEDKHVSNESVYDPKKQLLISIDFNLNPFGVIFAHLFKDKDGEHLHVFDELSIENGSIDLMVQRIKEKYYKSLAGCILTGDAMGKQRNLTERDNASNYDLLKRGLRIRSSQVKVGSNPTHDRSRNDFNTVLLNFNDVSISPECKGLIRDLKTVQCDVYGKILKRNRKDYSQRADHLDCFTGNTLVWTDYGEKRIEDIKVGQSVVSHKGIVRKVIDKWSSEREVYEWYLSDGTKIECTKDHFFYVEQYGWLPIFIIFEYNLPLWKSKLFTTELSIENTQNKNTTTVLTDKAENNTQEAYIGKCGTITTEKYQMTTKYTTKMAMPLIILLKTWNWFIRLTTLGITQKSGLKKTQNLQKNSNKKESKKQSIGTEAKKVKNGIVNILKRCFKTSQSEKKNVTNAEQYLNTKQYNRLLGFVQTIASQNGEEYKDLIMKIERVNGVDHNLKSINTVRQDFVHGHVLVNIDQVKNKGVQTVYDITVEEDHSFYANGVVTHNCMRYLINTHLSKWVKYYQKKGHHTKPEININDLI